MLLGAASGATVESPTSQFSAVFVGLALVILGVAISTLPRLPRCTPRRMSRVVPQPAAV
jgi:hypothetical protein